MTMSGISKQVGRYRAAARSKNMGSQPSAEQTNTAKQTALGGRNVSARRGSWEGYQSGHSTYIHANGTGYDSTQRARRNPRTPTDFSGSSSTAHPSSRRGGGSSNVFDYTYSGSAGNSISMMNRQRALDNSRYR